MISMIETLSLREKQVLSLVANGKSYKEVAKAMDLALPTVKVYMKNARDKLGAINSNQALVIFSKG